MKNKLIIKNIMNIKQSILLVVFLFLSFKIFAQNEETENIRALKVVFITEQLELSPKEAEKFWPIYNLYSNKEYDLRFVQTRNLRKQIMTKGGVNAISDIEADMILQKLVDIENEIASNKNQIIQKLKPIISSKKLIKLQIAEFEFNKKVLEELRKRRMERYKKN